MTSFNTTKLLIRLWGHFSLKRRKQFGCLVLLMLITSLLETVSVGAVMPFLGVLTSPEKIYTFGAMQPLIRFFDLTSPSQLLAPIMISFALTSLLAGMMRVLLLWANTKLSFAIGADLGISIYRRTLYQPYSVHCSRNSSEVIAGITSKADGVIGNILLPSLTQASALIMLSMILVTLLLIDPYTATFAFFGFGAIYLIIAKVSRKRLREDGEVMAKESVQVIKSLQEGLGGIRDVLIDGSQEVYCDIYRKSDLKRRIAQGRTIFFSGSPRYVMESLGLILISFISYITVRSGGSIAESIPILGLLALGAQRMLPLLQQIFSSWAIFRSGLASLEQTLELLDQPLPSDVEEKESAPIIFEHGLALNQVSFRYENNGPHVLKDINLAIPRGSRVGFVGHSGSGKSTLVDIIMGLLEPIAGRMEVDGQLITKANSRLWQSHVAHVPQSIYLADASIRENIAFGVPKDEIDFELVKHVSAQAKLSEVIECLPEKYDTHVGERGVRLSGGQRQRIGIARALYKRADLIIFDEATSALDTETEQKVMEAIKELSSDLTILVVAHRVTTLKDCDKIYKLDKSKIERVNSYHELSDK